MNDNKNTDMPFVSVVVCTYNRKNLLQSCLKSIYAQDYHASNFEVIIVDGGSTDGTEELCKVFPQLKFVTESKFGLAYARNKGAELARGSIVVYTDDDCIVDKQWLRSLITEFQFSKKVMGVGGPVFPLQPKIIPKRILVNAAFGLFDEGNKVKQTSGIITSNSAFRKELFDIMQFDETLGVTRRTKLILSGEDTDFCRRIVDSGFKLRYTPYAKVYHRIHKERVRVPYIVKRALHTGLSLTRMYLNEKHSRIWAIRYATGQLIQSIFKLTSDPSFVSLYAVLYHLSAFCISVTGLDVIFLS